MKSIPSQKVVLLPLFFKKQLQTDGTTTFSYIDVDLPQALEWGPYLESIQAHTTTENRTTNFSWKVGFFWSMDGRRWNPTSTPVDLFSALATNTDTVQTAYTTNTTFGLKMRYVIAVANTGGTNVERAVCGCVLAFTFKS